MGTVKRSRNPAAVLAAGGGVHTHEEAQASVHDLSLCVTVQVLDNTLAVLSQGKLGEDHALRRPRFAKTTDARMSGSAVKSHASTEMGKNIICKTDNFVPLVFTGLSVNSGSRSSSTSLPQESLRQQADQASGNRGASSSSPGSVFERSDEQAPRALGHESLRSVKKDVNDPLAYLPIFVRVFTDNLEDTEVLAPAHISQDSDSEHPTNVVTIEEA